MLTRHYNDLEGTNDIPERNSGETAAKKMITDYQMPSQINTEQEGDDHLMLNMKDLFQDFTAFKQLGLE